VIKNKRLAETSRSVLPSCFSISFAQSEQNSKQLD